MLSCGRFFQVPGRIQSCRWIHMRYIHARSFNNTLENQLQTHGIMENRRQIKIGSSGKLQCRFRQFGPTKGNLSLLKDITSLHRSPAPPLVLGASGLIPFITPPIIMYTQAMTCPELVNIQLCYGAVILSFLGGVRWGMAATPGSPIPGNWAHYSWSVTPSLIAWMGLILPGFAPGYISVISGLGLTCYKDLAQIGYPSWFKGLRIILTLVAIISMASSLVITYTFPSKKSLIEAFDTTKMQINEQYIKLATDKKEEAEESTIAIQNDKEIENVPTK